VTFLGELSLSIVPLAYLLLAKGHISIEVQASKQEADMPPEFLFASFLRRVHLFLEKKSAFLRAFYSKEGNSSA
jgi:hypothetical protein